MTKPEKQSGACEHCNSFHKSMFCGLEKSRLAQMDSHKTVNTYKKHQVIFHEGNRPLGVYCLKRGKVKIYKTGVEGREQIVRLAGPGELIGYRSFLGEEFYSASSAAIEESEICFIDKDDFFGVMKDNEDFSLKLIKLMSHELREAENRLQGMAQKSVRERLAEVLLVLKAKFGMDAEDDKMLSSQMTREELANFVGTATETLIRLLSDLKEEGVIESKGRRLRIIDEAALLEMSGLDY